MCVRYILQLNPYTVSLCKLVAYTVHKESMHHQYCMADAVVGKEVDQGQRLMI